MGNSTSGLTGPHQGQAEGSDLCPGSPFAIRRCRSAEESPRPPRRLPRPTRDDFRPQAPTGSRGDCPGHRRRHGRRTPLARTANNAHKHPAGERQPRSADSLPGNTFRSPGAGDRRCTASSRKSLSPPNSQATSAQGDSLAAFALTQCRVAEHPSYRFSDHHPSSHRGWLRRHGERKSGRRPGTLPACSHE